MRSSATRVTMAIGLSSDAIDVGATSKKSERDGTKKTAPVPKDRGG